MRHDAKRVNQDRVRVSRAAGLFGTAATVILLGAMVPAVGWAQAPAAETVAQAQQLFDQGVAATDRGDFAAGLAAFAAAYALNPLADTLYNVAMCRMALEDWAGAVNDFRDYVAARGGRLAPDEQAEFDRLQAELLPRIGRLAIDVGQPGAAVSIDGTPAGVAPLPAWVAITPGRHTVTAEKEGFQPASSVVEVAPGQLLDVPLLLVALAMPPGPTTNNQEPTPRLSPWF
jgi:tetratricopeptide (TPR) repeat protein